MEEEKMELTSEDVELTNKPMDLSFLKAPRFWVMIVGTVAVYLKAKGYIGEPEMMLVASTSALFVTVRTVDRFGEQPKTTDVITK